MRMQRLEAQVSMGLGFERPDQRPIQRAGVYRHQHKGRDRQEYEEHARDQGRQFAPVAHG